MSPVIVSLLLLIQWTGLAFYHNFVENLDQVVFEIKDKFVISFAGFHDQKPEFTQNSVGSAVKFCPYKEVVGRTSAWLQNEKVNICLIMIGWLLSIA